MLLFFCNVYNVYALTTQYNVKFEEEVGVITEKVCILMENEDTEKI